MILKRAYRKIKGLWLSVRGYLHSRLVLGWLIHSSSQESPMTPRTAMVFAPHQDDETLGCGGLLALKQAEGAQTWVVFLTDGEASFQYDRSADKTELSQTRCQEAKQALSILGVPDSQIYFLNQPDGQLSILPPSQQETLLQQLTKLLERHQPAEIYIPHRWDGHPDHEMTYDYVKQALERSLHSAELWQYPVWVFWNRCLFWNLTPQAFKSAHRISIHSVLALKKAAIAAYASQHPVLPPGFLQNHDIPYELFFKEPEHESPSRTP
jgi:N-acetylglucosamine malate deacetylase 1